MFLLKKLIKQFSYIVVILAASSSLTAVLAHPTGNLVSIGGTAYFPYVVPIDHPNHKSSVLSWQMGGQVEVVLTSEYTASDFMLSALDNNLYIIERRYQHSNSKNYIRLLELQSDNSTNTIWPWFEDKWRLGEGGFHVQSDQQVIFVKYPDVLLHKADGSVDQAFEFPHPVKRLRKVEQGLLLLGENQAWLVDQQGKIKRQWDNLLNQAAANAPLNRNQIFDIDYQQGRLLVANWGNRSFDIVSHNNRQTSLMHAVKTPYTAHWVTHFNHGYLLMASTITFDGNNPRPLLIFKATADAQAQIIWQD
ncbi:hypothetical protein DS2_01340 [Catenovulum agarivorans DS-2]|uniref:Uncharacterized protein n=1 Tax=Catenovulum agarivorans DS-2 TaxID=1328313 RepID=W7QX63_9ALTE|nr:hypothetical protein [Catenovulum agarivorans]EWH12323.1 hypothetical protein DS2_01340 [Catenovulum agarivorans DS-2]